MLRSSLSRHLGRRHPTAHSRIWNLNRVHLSTNVSSSPGTPSDAGTSTSTTTTSSSSLDSPKRLESDSVFTGDEKPNNDQSSTMDKDRDAMDLAAVKQRLREWSGTAAITVRNRADDFTAATKSRFSQLGAHLNKVTGYEEIEALKKGVVEQESRISVARKNAREAKTRYAEAVLQRSNSQREVNDLLQRKSTWTDSDVGRFTTLVRQDHLFEREEWQAKNNVDQSEEAVDKEFSKLMRSILARYHEEQVWSDKIRSASTYGSLAALGLNLLVFIMAIVVVEPWKRRRLAQTFEKKIEEMSGDNAAQLRVSMGEIGRQLADQEKLLIGVTDELKVKIEAVAELERKQQETLRSVEEQASLERTREHNDSVWWQRTTLSAGIILAGIVGNMFISR